MGNSQTKTELDKLYEKYPDFPKNQKLFGLENFGNTCYCNSVLQVLYFCVPFRNKILQYYCEVKGLPSIVNNSSNNNSNDENDIDYDNNNNNSSKSNNSGDSPKNNQHVNNNNNQNVNNNNNNGNNNNGNNNTSYVRNMFSFFGFSSNSNTSGGSGTGGSNGSYKQTEKDDNLILNLGELFYTIQQSKDTHGCLKPETFVERLKKENELFSSSYMHQDAHEFLNFLLNSIAEYLQKQQKQTNNNNDTKKEFKTLVHEIFEGTLTNETKCLTCESITNKDESFLDLSIDIEQNKSLTSCLSNFSSVEILSKNDKFFCDKCNSLQEAQKRMKIKKLPNTLIIHLKRFKYMETIQQYTKLNYRVVFPFETIIQNTTTNIEEPDKKFNLFAVVIHVGSGPNHGHYYSLIKCHGVWFIFDDHHIDIREESDLYECFGSSSEFNNDCGYLLFYQSDDSK